MLGDEREFQRRLIRWYDAHRRDLPWRPPPSDPLAKVDPYFILVSEAMLQQTQVATVVPYFTRFLERFPTAKSLAESDEQEVLRLWQGLGYYSRARNLRKAAQQVVTDFDGRVPTTVEELLRLPGVGRYTAGAVASIAHGTRAPILDGNVARVLCRLDLIQSDPREKATLATLWARAEAVLPAERVGDFNSAMMELGATVCVPRNPACLVCPVRAHCAAQAAGLQETVPPPKKAKETPLETRVTLCVRRGGKYLIEQRPATGRWAGMWQFVTLPGTTKPKLQAGIRPETVVKLGVVRHGLTHRRYRFTAYACEADDEGPEMLANRVWTKLAELAKYPMSKPQLEIARLLADLKPTASRRGR